LAVCKVKITLQAIFGGFMREAQQTARGRFFSPLRGPHGGKNGGEPPSVLRCELCPRLCRIPPGGRGACGVRENRNGPAIPFYGLVTASALDPIEKKPLYHFRPGSRILSLGFAGCNLYCPFCQNWRISQVENTGSEISRIETPRRGGGAIPGRFVSAGAAAGEAVKNGGLIAYTYSEPLVHIEYLLDAMTAVKEAGAANVLVSNGCINSGPAGEILALIAAANIDLKCFSGETYERTLGGKLETVLDFITLACKTGVHVEVTTLVVPGLNDSPQELAECASFIAGLEKDYGPVPWHLSAYHPDYRWDAPATDTQALLEAAERAAEKVQYVYTGNIQGGDRRFSDTFCSGCGAALVRRTGYRTDTGGLLRKNGTYVCGACGKAAPFR
jgi:pyruvate formate lyase activating enzyme